MTHRKNGFILLLIVAMIPLVGMVLAILSSNSASLSIRTRSELLQVKAENASQSGLAWAHRHPADVQSLRLGEPVEFTISEGPLRRVFCRIERLSDPNVVQITGFAEGSRLKAHVEHRLLLSTP